MVGSGCPVSKNHRPRVAAFIVLGLALWTIPASAQDREHRSRRHADDPMPMKTANEAYWDAVRASTGPIGFPQARPDDELTRRERARARGFGPAVFASVPFVTPPAPVYVPVPVY